MTRTVGTTDRTSGVAWAAAAWAAVFGAGGIYGAVGGTAGLGLVAKSIRDDILQREPDMVAALWIYGSLKLAAATVPLAASRLRPLGRRLLGLVQRAVGVAFLLWGGAYALVGGLVVGAVRSAPDGWGPHAATWYLVLWGPVWMLGGLLFLAAGRRAPRRRIGDRTRRSGAFADATPRAGSDSGPARRTGAIVHVRPADSRRRSV